MERRRYCSPFVSCTIGKEYEVDEICTYIKKKANLVWIAYSIRRDTKEVVDFAVGRRTTQTLRKVTETLVSSAARIGNGIAAMLIHGKNVKYFYGEEVNGGLPEFIKSYEGNGQPGHPLERYDDTKGKATDGYGHLMNEQDKKDYPIPCCTIANPNQVGSAMTERAAFDQFNRDFDKHETGR
jgi:hypothetical protein